MARQPQSANLYSSISIQERHMSRLAEFRKLEQQLAAQLAELETLKNDDGLKREIEFETKLRDLLGGIRLQPQGRNQHPRPACC
jgi:hypothetical protein